MRDTFELLLEQAKAGVESVQTAFTKPDDDWQPVLLLANDERATVLGIDGAFFASQGAKDTLADLVLVEAIFEFEAEAVSMISSAWSAAIPNDGGSPPTFLPPEEMPSQRADRQEVVMIYTASLDRWTDSLAFIERHPDAPPTLGEWEDIPQTQTGAGRFPRAIDEGLRLVAAGRN